MNALVLATFDLFLVFSAGIGALFFLRTWATSK